MVTIWIFCKFNESIEKNEKWSESSILRYNLIIQNEVYTLKATVKIFQLDWNIHDILLIRAFFVVTHTKKCIKYGYHLRELHFPTDLELYKYYRVRISETKSICKKFPYFLSPAQAKSFLDFGSFYEKCKEF